MSETTRPGSAMGPTIGRRRFLQSTAGALVAPAVAGLPAAARAQDKVELLFWAWTPDTQTQVDLFQKKYPGISVKLENVGQGPPHYVKLRNAIKAGSGLPDVAQMEFNSIASFKQLGVLADLGAARRRRCQGQFVDWTWKSVQRWRQGLRRSLGQRADGPALPRRRVRQATACRCPRPGTTMPSRRSS